MPDSKAVDGLRKFSRKWIRGAGRTLVVGAKCYGDKPDRRKLYRNAVGVDLFEGDGVDLVHDMEGRLPESAGRFDHVDCVSVLEHVRRPWLMAQSIEAAMVPCGTLLVSVPFCWRIHSYPGDYWRMTPEALEVLFPSIYWYQVRYLSEGKEFGIVPRLTVAGKRWLGRSEVIAAGFKCA